MYKVICTVVVQKSNLPSRKGRYVLYIKKKYVSFLKSKQDIKGSRLWVQIPVYLQRRRKLTFESHELKLI